MGCPFYSLPLREACFTFHHVDYSGGSPLYTREEFLFSLRGGVTSHIYLLISCLPFLQRKYSYWDSVCWSIERLKCGDEDLPLQLCCNWPFCPHPPVAFLRDCLIAWVDRCLSNLWLWLCAFLTTQICFLNATVCWVQFSNMSWQCYCTCTYDIAFWVYCIQAYAIVLQKLDEFVGIYPVLHCPILLFS